MPPVVIKTKICRTCYRDTKKGELPLSFFISVFYGMSSLKMLYAATYFLLLTGIERSGIRSTEITAYTTDY